MSGVDARPRGYSSAGSRKSEGSTETEPRRGSNPRPISTGVPTQAIDVNATQPMGVKKHVPYKRPKGSSTSDGEIDQNDKDDAPSARGDDSQKSSNGTSGKVCLDDFEVRRSPHAPSSVSLLHPAGRLLQHGISGMFGEHKSLPGTCH